MGFETYATMWHNEIEVHFNFVPMGFETSFARTLKLLRFILTLSLWDLKLVKHMFDGKSTVILTLSLWDLKREHEELARMLKNDFNFVPMGFETLSFLFSVYV